MKTTTTIPGSLIGPASIAFETLVTRLLTKKDKAKCISIVNNTVKNLARTYGKPAPVGTIIIMSKVLDVITDDVSYVVTFSSEEGVEL